jgi:hypothetical protein
MPAAGRCDFLSGNFLEHEIFRSLAGASPNGRPTLAEFMNGSRDVWADDKQRGHVNPESASSLK